MDRRPQRGHEAALRYTGGVVDVPRPSFGYRQAAGDPTAGQILFDLLFGVVLPVICLVADPIVFRSNDWGPGGILVRYAAFAYVLIGTQMLFLILWLALHRRLAASGAWFAGPLAAGALFAGGLGLILFPFSVLGLVAVVGALGFTPLLTSFVFYRNAVRASKAARERMSPRARRILLAMGLLCAPLPAVAADLAAERLTREALARPEKIDGLVLRLLDGDRVIAAYATCPPGPRRDALAGLYRRLTGADIEERLSSRSD